MESTAPFRHPNTINMQTRSKIAVKFNWGMGFAVVGILVSAAQMIASMLAAGGTDA